MASIIDSFEQKMHTLFMVLKVNWVQKRKKKTKQKKIDKYNK